MWRRCALARSSSSYWNIIGVLATGRGSCIRSASSSGSTPASKTPIAVAIFGSSATVILGMIACTAVAVW